MEKNERLVLWTLTDRKPVHAEWRIDALIAYGHLAPAALGMSARDIMHQFNNENGGEVWLTEVAS